MSVIDEAKAKIKGRRLKLVMPEGEDERIRAAAERFVADDLAVPVVFAAEDVPETEPHHIAILRQRREKLNDAMAARLLRKPLYRAGAMVAAGEAHAMLAGAANPTARVIEAALMTIGPAPGIETPSSFFLMQWPERRLVFADCGVNIQPSAAELADIAIASAASAARFLGDKELGLTVSSLLPGCALGAFLAGRFADRFGRRAVMMMAAPISMVRVGISEKTNQPMASAKSIEA